MLRLRTLAQTDIRVSELCLGTADFGFKLNPDESLKFIEAFLERGGNFLDTAHCYAFWVNQLGVPERIVGQAAAKFGRDKVVIATKGGHVGMAPGYPRPDAFLTPEIVNNDLSESLDRLKVDQVDLYYFHRDDPRVPVVEMMDLGRQLVESRQVRYLGASNWSLARVEQANAIASAKGWPKFVAVQNQWSLATPTWMGNILAEPEAGMTLSIKPDQVTRWSQLGLAMVPYSPNANGFFASNGAKAAGTYGESEGLQQLERVNAFAKARGISPGTVAMAYLYNQPIQTIPITGTGSLPHLDEAIRAASVRLTPEDLDWLQSGHH